MEKSDEKLIEKYIHQDAELRRHIDEHECYEKLLENFNKRVYLTPEEEMEKKEISKTKTSRQGQDSRDFGEIPGGLIHV